MAAALADPPGSRTVDLRSIDADALAPILAEQVESWKNDLHWDFTPSANLVRRFVQIHALAGSALISGNEVIGYSYFVCEDGKGLIGDLYVLRRYRNADREYALLQSSLDAMWQTPGVHRVESQLLMLMDVAQRQVPYLHWFHSHRRFFLEAPLDPALAQRRLASSMAIALWTEAWQEATGRLIAGAYQNHIDSQINDQYRSVGGALRFLTNIVQYPGCGLFFGPASFAARDRNTGALCGISLASMVAADVGHITQVCVAPSHRGKQVGYELLRRSVESLAAHQCRSVTLTVTKENETALRLYERMGFRLRREFAAYVWDMT